MSQASTISLRPPPPSPSVPAPFSGSFNPADASQGASQGTTSPSIKHGLSITLGIVCAAFALLVLWAVWRFWQNFWFVNRVSGTRGRRKRMFWRTRTSESGCVEAGAGSLPENEKDSREEGTTEQETEKTLPTPPRLPALIWSPRRNSGRPKHQRDASLSLPPPYASTPPSPLGVPSSSSSASSPFPTAASTSTPPASSQIQNSAPPNPFFTPLPPPLPRKPHQRSPRNSIISSLHPNYYYQNQNQNNGTYTYSHDRDALARGQNRVGRSPLSISSSSGIASDYDAEGEGEEDDREGEVDDSPDSTQEGVGLGNGNGHIYMKANHGQGQRQGQTLNHANANGNGNGSSRRSSYSFSGSMVLNTIMEGGDNDFNAHAKQDA